MIVLSSEQDACRLGAPSTTPPCLSLQRGRGNGATNCLTLLSKRPGGPLHQGALLSGQAGRYNVKVLCHLARRAATPVLNQQSGGQ